MYAIRSYYVILSMGPKAFGLFQAFLCDFAALREIRPLPGFATPNKKGEAVSGFPFVASCNAYRQCRLTLGELEATTRSAATVLLTFLVV